MDAWTGRATNALKKYEVQLFESFKDGSYESANGETEKQWTFWNAVFYCGTIYTTIGETQKVNFFTKLFYLRLQKSFMLF